MKEMNIGLINRRIFLLCIIGISAIKPITHASVECINPFNPNRAQSNKTFDEFDGLVVTHSYCPNDVIKRSHSCMSNFISQVDSLRHTEQYFISGMDPETIRITCSTLEEGWNCMFGMIKSCSESEQSRLDSVYVKPYQSISQLCIRMKNLYEDYSMNKYCFSNLNRETSLCLEDFYSAVGRYNSQHRQPHRTRHPASRHCSSREKVLISCINYHVKRSCSPSAVGLVDDLVKATVSLTTDCSADVPDDLENNGSDKSSQNKKQYQYNPGWGPANNPSNSAPSSTLHWKSILWTSQLLFFSVLTTLTQLHYFV